MIAVAVFDEVCQRLGGVLWLLLLLLLLLLCVRWAAPHIRTHQPRPWHRVNQSSMLSFHCKGLSSSLPGARSHNTNFQPTTPPPAHPLLQLAVNLTNHLKQRRPRSLHTAVCRSVKVLLRTQQLLRELQGRNHRMLAHGTARTAANTLVVVANAGHVQVTFALCRCTRLLGHALLFFVTTRALRPLCSDLDDRSQVFLSN